MLTTKQHKLSMTSPPPPPPSPPPPPQPPKPPPTGLLGHEGRPCVPPVARPQRQRPPRRPCGGEVAGRAPCRGRRTAAAAEACLEAEEAKSASAAATRPPRESYPGTVGRGLGIGLEAECTFEVNGRFHSYSRQPEAWWRLALSRAVGPVQGLGLQYYSSVSA